MCEDRTLTLNSREKLLRKPLPLSPGGGSAPAKARVDYIGTPAEEAEVRQHLGRAAPWDRVLILNPNDLRAYEL